MLERSEGFRFYYRFVDNYFSRRVLINYFFEVG